MTFETSEATDRGQGNFSGLGPLAEDGTGGSDDSGGSKTDKSAPGGDE